MVEAVLHDGSIIEIEVSGAGPVVLLPVNPRPIEGAAAQAMRDWGADPALGRSLVDGLAGTFRVVAFDYEGHVLAHPKPDTLTPANVAADVLAVADAAGADRFAYYGYSWLALTGLQLALRTDRLSALVMGGFPPIDGPYAEMLRVTEATHQGAGSQTGTPAEKAPPAVLEEAGEFDWSSVEVSMSEPQTRQFMTLYQALSVFDDRGVSLTCPRLCFAGSNDEIDYGERWGDVHVSMAGPLVRRRAELERRGWDVHLFDGLDHTHAMQAATVLPLVRPWLAAALGTADRNSLAGSPGSSRG